MSKLLLTFIVLNILNVIIQTVKSLVTIKCGKCLASLVNAVAFGLYTIVTVYTLCDLNLWLKAGVVAICNLVGVFVVKWLEEIARKDKLWKVEAVVKDFHTARLANELDELDIPYNYIENIGKRTLFNIYCATQKDSHNVRELLKDYNAKYFVTETKNL